MIFLYFVILNQVCLFQDRLKIALLHHKEKALDVKSESVVFFLFEKFHKKIVSSQLIEQLLQPN